MVVTKVAAHCSVAAAVSPLETWCFAHNALVDQAAEFGSATKA